MEKGGGGNVDLIAQGGEKEDEKQEEHEHVFAEASQAMDELFADTSRMTESESTTDMLFGEAFLIDPDVGAFGNTEEKKTRANGGGMVMVDGAGGAGGGDGAISNEDRLEQMVEGGSEVTEASRMREVECSAAGEMEEERGGRGGERESAVDEVGACRTGMELLPATRVEYDLTAQGGDVGVVINGLIMSEKNAGKGGGMVSTRMQSAARTRDHPFPVCRDIEEFDRMAGLANNTSKMDHRMNESDGGGGDVVMGERKDLEIGNGRKREEDESAEAMREEEWGQQDDGHPEAESDAMVNDRGMAGDEPSRDPKGGGGVGGEVGGGGNGASATEIVVVSAAAAAAAAAGDHPDRSVDCQSQYSTLSSFIPKTIDVKIEEEAKTPVAAISEEEEEEPVLFFYSKVKRDTSSHALSPAAAAAAPSPGPSSSLASSTSAGENRPRGEAAAAGSHVAAIAVGGDGSLAKKKTAMVDKDGESGEKSDTRNGLGEGVAAMAMAARENGRLVYGRLQEVKIEEEILTFSGHQGTLQEKNYKQPMAKRDNLEHTCQQLESMEREKGEGGEVEPAGDRSCNLLGKRSGSVHVVAGGADAAEKSSGASFLNADENGALISDGGGDGGGHGGDENGASSDEESGTSSDDSSSSTSDSDDDSDSDSDSDDDDDDDETSDEAMEVEREENAEFVFDNSDGEKIDEDEKEEENADGEKTDDDAVSIDLDKLDDFVAGIKKKGDGLKNMTEEEADVTGTGVAGPPRTKNELAFLPPVPTVEAELLPRQELREVGVISSVMDAIVVVQGTGKERALDDGTVLWLSASRKCLGLVDEIFGPVVAPLYSVRFNSAAEVPEEAVPDAAVSYVEDYAKFILNDASLHKKGYDASGAHDEELPEEEVEFSDDEKEAEAKRLRKMAKRRMKNETEGDNGSEQGQGNGLKAGEEFRGPAKRRQRGRGQGAGAPLTVEGSPIGKQQQQNGRESDLQAGTQETMQQMANLGLDANKRRKEMCMSLSAGPGQLTGEQPRHSAYQRRLGEHMSDTRGRREAMDIQERNDAQPSSTFYSAPRKWSTASNPVIPNVQMHPRASSRDQTPPPPADRAPASQLHPMPPAQPSPKRPLPSHNRIPHQRDQLPPPRQDWRPPPQPNRMPPHQPEPLSSVQSDPMPAQRPDWVEPPQLDSMPRPQRDQPRPSQRDQMQRPGQPHMPAQLYPRQDQARTWPSTQNEGLPPRLGQVAPHHQDRQDEMPPPRRDGIPPPQLDREQMPPCRQEDQGPQWRREAGRMPPHQPESLPSVQSHRMPAQRPDWVAPRQPDPVHPPQRDQPRPSQREQMQRPCQPHMPAQPYPRQDQARTWPSTQNGGLPPRLGQVAPRHQDRQDEMPPPRREGIAPPQLDREQMPPFRHEDKGPQWRREAGKTSTSSEERWHGGRASPSGARQWPNGRGERDACDPSVHQWQQQPQSEQMPPERQGSAVMSRPIDSVPYPSENRHHGYQSSSSPREWPSRSDPAGAEAPPCSRARTPHDQRPVASTAVGAGDVWPDSYPDMNRHLSQGIPSDGSNGDFKQETPSGHPFQPWPPLPPGPRPASTAEEGREQLEKSQEKRQWQACTPQPPLPPGPPPPSAAVMAGEPSQKPWEKRQWESPSPQVQSQALHQPGLSPRRHARQECNLPPRGTPHSHPPRTPEADGFSNDRQLRNGWPVQGGSAPHHQQPRSNLAHGNPASRQTMLARRPPNEDFTSPRSASALGPQGEFNTTFAGSPYRQQHDEREPAALLAGDKEKALQQQAWSRPSPMPSSGYVGPHSPITGPQSKGGEAFHASVPIRQGGAEAIYLPSQEGTSNRGNPRAGRPNQGPLNVSENRPSDLQAFSSRTLSWEGYGQTHPGLPEPQRSTSSGPYDSNHWSASKGHPSPSIPPPQNWPSDWGRGA